ncbi:MAG: ABC transporter ATP-binding protein [Gallintestinimicrobium sp.]
MVVLLFSMGSTYLQAVILQRVGQRIVSDLREDLFTHIESLSHEQLNEIPVGKLVTRVTNDTNAISMMFTNLLVSLTKNAFVIVGILIAMICLNYELTLMVLCFVPFIVIFTVIFRKFSRRACRVKDATTDINTYLSENLSGIKVTQIFGREEEKMVEFREKSQTQAKANLSQIFVFSVFRPLVYMLYICSILCLFYLGGMGHLNGVAFKDRRSQAERSLPFICIFRNFSPRSRTWRNSLTGCSRLWRLRKRCSRSWIWSRSW